uniref:Uncharacterized protein n=1 Tax=Cyprinus carpio TaxID=7962 RepID=A0A8C2IJC6_CYPCA
MKTSVKMYLWLPRRKQLRLHSDITITITSLQNQTHQIPLRIPLLQVFITTTIGTRVTKDRVTQITVIHQ